MVQPWEILVMVAAGVASDMVIVCWPVEGRYQVDSNAQVWGSFRGRPYVVGAAMQPLQAACQGFIGR